MSIQSRKITDLTEQIKEEPIPEDTPNPVESQPTQRQMKPLIKKVSNRCCAGWPSLDFNPFLHVTFKCAPLTFSQTAAHEAGRRIVVQHPCGHIDLAGLLTENTTSNELGCCATQGS